MDVNETLARLDAWAAAKLDSNIIDADSTTDDEAAELFAALNEWLSKGGFLPEPWRQH